MRLLIGRMLLWFIDPVESARFAKLMPLVCRDNATRPAGDRTEAA